MIQPGKRLLFWMMAAILWLPSAVSAVEPAIAPMDHLDLRYNAQILLNELNKGLIHIAVFIPPAAEEDDRVGSDLIWDRSVLLELENQNGAVFAGHLLGLPMGDDLVCNFSIGHEEMLRSTIHSPRRRDGAAGIGGEAMRDWSVWVMDVEGDSARIAEVVPVTELAERINALQAE